MISKTVFYWLLIFTSQWVLGKFVPYVREEHTCYIKNKVDLVPLAWQKCLRMVGTKYHCQIYDAIYAIVPQSTDTQSLARDTP